MFFDSGYDEYKTKNNIVACIKKKFSHQSSRFTVIKMAYTITLTEILKWQA